MMRALLKSPAFTITAVTVLALGIGATTAIFSVVNAVLLKPLPVADPDHLVFLTNRNLGDGNEQNNDIIGSPANFAHWRAQSSVIQDVSAFLNGFENYTGGETPEQLHSMRASVNLFRCWRVPILRGRSFTQEEDLPNGPRVVLISEALWKRRFLSDPQILGKTISLSGEPYTVIGVTGDVLGLHEFTPGTEVYVPFQLDPNTSDQGHFFLVSARLKPGVTLKEANARLQSSAGEYRAKFPGELGPKDSFGVASYRDVLVGDSKVLLWVLLGAVGLVLLIACANVANLLLVRATGRKREIAIRMAVGAGRARMIRQMLSESILLALAGGALGLLLGYAGIRALLAVNTAGLPRMGQNGEGLDMDWRVMGFALAVSLATGIVFGLLPAIQSSRVDLNSELKENSGRSGTGLRQNKARAVLVVSEVSLAVVLLVGSALLIRTIVALYKVDRGFEARNVSIMRTSLTGPRYQKSVSVADTIRNGLERVRALPGVAAATATCCVPLEGGFGLPFEVIGRAPLAKGTQQDAGWSIVSPGFFDVFKIPVRRGRAFTDRDDGKSQPVVVISERMAKEFWKDSDPLKDRIIIGTGVMKELKDEPARQIIGVVGDVRDQGLDNEPRPVMYVPQAQLPDATNVWMWKEAPVAWVVRTQADSHGLTVAIQEQLRQAIGLPVTDLNTMDQIVSLSTGRQRFSMLLMSVFGAMALLLAAIGLYGLMAYTVEQRTQEIGIRMALGAESSQVRNMVVRQGMVLALAGLAVGLAAALALAKAIESFLFGVKARDPIVFVAVPAVLAAVALLAVWVPATRASRVNPVDSLRCQ